MAAEPGQEFAWLVGGAWVRWGFTLAPVDGGTRLTESWEFLPAGIARVRGAVRRRCPGADRRTHPGRPDRHPGHARRDQEDRRVGLSPAEATWLRRTAARVSPGGEHRGQYRASGLLRSQRAGMSAAHCSQRP